MILPGQGWPLARPPLDVPFTVNWDSLQAQGLVGWWPTAGFSGANVLPERTGQFAAGAVSGSTWQTDAQFGTVLDYDGNDKVDCGNAPVAWTAGASKLSMSLWAKTSNLAADQRAFFHYKDGGAGSAGIWMDTGDSDGWAFFIRIASGPGSRTVGTAVASAIANTWQHILGTFDGRYLRVYVDGLLRDTTDCGGSETIAGGTGSLFLGWMEFTNQYYTGQLADARLYKRVLSAAEAWQMWAPQTRWELYRPLTQQWVVKAPSAGVPFIGPRLASIGSRGRPFISPDLGGIR